MVAPQNIAALEIIGYANRLTSSMWPVIVPPIFRVRAQPDRILFPAFVIHEGFVCNASERSAAELAKLDAAGEITLFKKPVPAQQDFELWIDAQGHPKYQPIPEAAARLRAIATQNIASAETALRAGHYAEAADCCRIALCADDRLLEPLAISAAIARRENDPARERTMLKLAQGRATPSGFKLLVDGFANVAPAPAVMEIGDLFTRRPMSGMAALRAA